MARDDAAERALLQRVIDEDVVGQLRRREGQMARLLDDADMLEQVEAEARAIQARGIRHIIWAGMGGSVMAVRVLCELGFGGRAEAAAEESLGQAFALNWLSVADPRGAELPIQHADQSDSAIALYPLDSTDPAALNAVVRAIAAAKGLALSGATAEGADEPEWLWALLHDVLMIGVAMGMTSEEPITHLAWFSELLERAGLPAGEHLLVMTLPGSLLDAFAREHQAPSLPLQLDGGTGTGGRMSAPATRVFLLPAALYLTQGTGESGLLREVVRQAWAIYDLDRAAARPAEHPFVRLAATLGAASEEGACRMLLDVPDDWQALVPWIEQLLEESLGKGGKGVVVFSEQALDEEALGYRARGLLRVRVASEVSAKTENVGFVLAQPELASAKPRERLAALSASFLGWQLCMALYGYLHGIQFAGQPAVEDYKARARALRARADPLVVVAGWQPAFRAGPLTLLAPAGIVTPETATETHPGAAFGYILRAALRARSDGAAHMLRYLDVTVNGAAPAGVRGMLDERVRAIGNGVLGVPIKLRQAPAAYHSTEQSEMDGPAHLVSLRLVARETEPSLLGRYDNRFLHAQAVGTWQAMLEAGRRCCLLVIDGTYEDASDALAAFFADVARELLADGH